MSQLLSKKQLLELVPNSNTHILRLENGNKVPRRIKPDGRPNSKSFWVREEVERWTQDQIAKRDSSANASSPLFQFNP